MVTLAVIFVGCEMLVLDMRPKRFEQVSDSFAMYALPMAALKLKQGFGRLIRRSSDRGAVVILDSRISSRDYGRAFLEVLPKAAMYTGSALGVGERVEAWLQERSLSRA